MEAKRDLRRLPKAHLHLHFTGAMRPETLRELAETQGTRLPKFMGSGDPLRVPADERGWFRFQRSYDLARHLVNSETIMRRIIREAAEDDAAEGSRHLEIQVDPTSYAPHVGGLTPALEIILDEAKTTTAATGVEVGVIVAASRMRNPLDARILARLAVRYAGDQPGQVVGFGLSNDERAGNTAQFEPAFQIARRAGLALVPHGGELLGPDHIREVVQYLHPSRIGHGVRVAEDPALLESIVNQGIALEVCPASNVSLGVYDTLKDVPLAKLIQAGATIALGADDPLLFLSRLLDQYATARDQHQLADAQLAALAKASVKASLASDSTKKRLEAEIDDWLKCPPGTN
ncbi:adenosine deaminase [Mobiluncus mulieris 28-1]|uniref:adenosine deaminase n=1 Tax=Mobiluncus mulieris TaxID=2052 RepID=UPI0001BE7AA7|nr:adenosine deaminase [Mobiluncus mulieris]EEZ90757.1 adenosine deaminase [Mobiluncus mulieris 28-1]